MIKQINIINACKVNYFCKLHFTERKKNKMELTPAQLRRLGEHKYSCQSTSLLDPIMQHWWCWLAERTPLYLAPNLITIIGLSINVFTASILIYYSPDAKQEVKFFCFLLLSYHIAFEK